MKINVRNIFEGVSDEYFLVIGSHAIEMIRIWVSDEEFCKFFQKYKKDTKNYVNFKHQQLLHSSNLWKLTEINFRHVSGASFHTQQWLLRQVTKIHHPGRKKDESKLPLRLNNKKRWIIFNTFSISGLNLITDLREINFQLLPLYRWRVT